MICCRGKKCPVRPVSLCVFVTLSGFLVTRAHGSNYRMISIQSLCWLCVCLCVCVVIRPHDAETSASSSALMTTTGNHILASFGMSNTDATKTHDTRCASSRMMTMMMVMVQSALSLLFVSLYAFGGGDGGCGCRAWAWLRGSLITCKLIVRYEHAHRKNPYTVLYTDDNPEWVQPMVARCWR